MSGAAWAVVGLLTYLLFGIELAVRPALALGPTSVAPSFLIPLAVFVAMHAPPSLALWYGLIIGGIVDLLSPHGTEHASSLVLLGPHALGYALGLWFVLTIRGVMIRSNPLSVAVLSVFCAALINLVVVAVLTFRVLLNDPVEWRPAAELASGSLAALYTGGPALVLGFVLVRVGPLLGFHDPHARRGPRG